jgi:hypothetical protein
VWRRKGVVYRVPVGKPEGKRQVGRPLHRWEGNIKIKIYRTIIFSVVLYGCETWSFTLREECRLREFENRVLR